MKKKKITIIVASAVILLIIVALTSLSYMYRPHRDVSQEKTMATLSVDELHEKFINPKNNAAKHWADQIIEVSGAITEIEQQTTVFIEDKVQVDFDVDKQEGEVFINGTHITIKGRCVGFDDLLEIVKIDQAILIK